MSLVAIVNGERFERATSISVSRSLRNLVGWFDLTSSADERNALPIQLDDAIEIASGDGNVLFTGFVESLSVRQSADDHDIRISGRDITADLVDSTLRTKQFTGPISIDDLTRRVLDAQGLDFKIINEAGPLPKIESTELVSGQIGQGAFDFLEFYARRVQAVLTTNAAGDIVILRASPVSTGVTLLRETGNQATNILASSLELNNAGRYADYVCQSQLTAGGSGVDAGVDQVTDQSGTASDGQIRAGRFYEFEAEVAMNSDASNDRAKLEANVRRAASFSYRATIQGPPSGLAINRLVTVRDDFCNIADDLLITDIDTSFDLNRGTITDIGMTFRDAFTLEEELDRTTAARSATGDRFSESLP